MPNWAGATADASALWLIAATGGFLFQAWPESVVSLAPGMIYFLALCWTESMASLRDEQDK